jgi:hypothetical protein
MLSNAASLVTSSIRHEAPARASEKRQVEVEGNAARRQEKYVQNTF